MKLHLLLAVLIAQIWPCIATAQEGSADAGRPTSFTFAAAVGGERVYDSYLSPLVYCGPSLAFSARWSKAMPANPQRLTMHFDARLNAADTRNPARNAHIYDAGVQAAWGMRWHTTAGLLRLECGGAVQAEGGVLYSSRNGNNPAAGRLKGAIAAEGAAKYPVRIGRLSVLLEEEVALPLVGAFFSPAFGETYYEIYMGNHDGLAHFGWVGNHFCITNFIGGTLMLGKVGLRLGYRLDAATSWVCGINTHRVSHALEVGITTNLPSLPGRPAHPHTINAIY